MNDRHDSSIREDVLIDLSDARSWWIRGLEAAATVGMWWLWLYLMVPFFGMLLLWLNLSGWASRWIDLKQSRDLSTFLGFCAAVFAGIILAVVAWGGANYLAFLRRKPQVGAQPLDEASTAEWFGIDRETLHDWQEAKSMVVTHDDHGCIHCVICLPDGPEDWDTGL
jgi:poly-beta-1,6-N-acetyl-D-glucosamine biosynthesis protein PgaD